MTLDDVKADAELLIKQHNIDNYIIDLQVLMVQSKKIKKEK